MDALAPPISPDLTRSLTAKLAVGLLGWRDVRVLGDVLIGMPPPGLVDPGNYLADDVAEVPPYASSVTEVRAVISRLEALGWVLDVEDVAGGAKRARFTKASGINRTMRYGFSADATVAIARAACRTQGIEP